MKTIKLLLCFSVLGLSLINFSFAQSGHFDSLSTGMTNPGAYVLSLAMKDSTTYNLYTGGHFIIAGRKSAINIAEWIDTVANTGTPVYGDWVPLNTGVDSDVCALAMFNKYLYAGGKFDTAGGIATSHIARWDTAALKWDSLLGTLNGNVYALCVYNGNLYVGGDFTIINGDTVNRIAMWNDSAWSAVGKGFDTGAVYALTVSNDSLYAGGSFIKSNGMVVNHVAQLKGNHWDSLGGGTNNTVYALCDNPEYWGQLVAGGAFTKSGNIVTKYISVFDERGLNWDSLGSGTNDTVRALNTGNGVIPSDMKTKPGQGVGGGNFLLIGGNFDSAGGVPSPNIAGYLEDGWLKIGELHGPVFALANPYTQFVFAEGDNFVGGKFSESIFFSDTTNVNNIAYMYMLLPGGSIPTINNLSLVDIYPNPNNGIFTIALAGAQNFAPTIEIYNVLGEKVKSEELRAKSCEIDLQNQPNGIYLYRVLGEDGGLIGEGKVVIQK